jgi:hypothetical protein
VVPLSVGEPVGSGEAVSAHDSVTARLVADVAKLGATDAAAAEQLSAALASSGAGRARMDEVIAAAVADVESLGLSTGTPAGKQALVAAIERRLHETRATVDGGTADAGTQAAAADVNAAGYNGLANPAAPPMGGPGAGMPSMPSLPSMPMGGGMGGFSSLPAAAMQGLSSLAGGGGAPASLMHAATDGARVVAGASVIDKLPLSAVEFDRHAFPGGKDAYLQRYIPEALDIMGVQDPAARKRWTEGLMTALQRESSFNPLAVNLTDSNARATRALAADGLPAQASRGGLQMIPSTFGAFHQAGTSHNMYEPVADICAAMNYVVHDPKYGVSMDASNLGKVAQFNPHSRGGGY